MWKLFLRKSTFIYGILLTGLAFGVAFIPYGVSCSKGSSSKFPYYYILLIFLGIYGLLSYISGDIVIHKYKKSTGDINPVVPKEIEDSAWKYRWPFVFALITVLLVTAVLFIIFLVTKRWPGL